MLQKIKQQLIDNIVLLVIVTAGSIGSFKSVQVNIRVKELIDMQQRIIQLENTCIELSRTQDDLDDLRLELAKHLSGQTTKKK
jgi:hypothetical protein